MTQFSEEHKRKISQAMMGNKNTFGRKQSKEEIEKRVESLVGKKRTEESKRKMSLSHLGKVSWMLGKKHTEETRKKISESRKGKNCGEECWNYVKDRSKLAKQEERNGNRHKEWSRKVKNRDNWKCRINNKDCQGKVIAHHILPWSSFPELRYIINNGITLCHFHHPKKRDDEKRQIPTFKKLVES